MDYNLQQNFPLKNYNTFNIDENAKYYFEFNKLEDLYDFAAQNDIKTKFKKVLVLGEGSNILFSKFYDGLIIHPKISGIEICETKGDNVFVKVSSGTNWDDFVKWSVDNNLSGIENLSLIPGTVGASPVQNIGAYGVEAKDRIISVEGFLFEENKNVVFTNEECKFAYRQSIFKNKLKNKILITAVSFRLSKTHKFVLNYGDIEKEIASFSDLNIANIRQAIINIRERKLPDTQEFPNAGSFFKNPVISLNEVEKLKSVFSNIPVFPFSDNKWKISAGWLIEKSGWKGRRIANVGVYKNQALVIVNYGNAKGKEILDFSNLIKKSVFEKFGVSLETEVNIH